MTVCVLRTIFLYVFVSAAIRIMGKKQVGQLQPVEFVIILLLSELASIPMQDMKISVMYSVVPILTLMGLEMLASALGLKIRLFRRIFDGKPSIVVYHGAVDVRELRKVRYNIDELFTELRSNGISDLRDVEFAVLETNGNISVIQTAGSRPLSPSDMKITPKKSGYPCIVINDGKVSEQSLECAKISRRTLERQLKKNGITDIKDVFYAVMSTNGDFYYQLHEKESKKARRKNA